jgi:glycosyltransferase involved in cell wall biosynthesis
MKKILMIGPGNPNASNSGLGIAASEIASYVKAHSDLTLLQPEDVKEKNQAETRVIRQEDFFSDHNVMTDLATLSAGSGINPYWYQTSESAEETPKKEESVVYQALVSYSEEITRSAETFSFDLIYAHDWISFEAALRLKAKSKKPLILHVHSLDYDRSGKNSNSWVYQLEKEAFQKADAIISVSEYTKQVMIREYDASPSKIHVIHNGHSPKKLPENKSPFKEKIVLFVGRLTGQKGAHQFLKIAELVHEQQPKTRFVMVGDGDLYASLVESGAKSPIASKFHLTNYLTGNDLLQAYAMADVFCMPSVSEPFGLTALEAAGAGIPVVLSNNSGVAEVLPSAPIAQHDDPQAFAEHILTILKSAKLKKQLSTEGKKQVKELTWKKAGAKILGLLNSY